MCDNYIKQVINLGWFIASHLRVYCTTSYRKKSQFVHNVCTYRRNELSIFCTDPAV